MGMNEPTLSGLGAPQSTSLSGMLMARLSLPTSDLNAFGSGRSPGAWTSEDEYPRLLADVTGDNAADIVGFGYYVVYVAPSHDLLLG